jgi:hypothetical protein
MTQACDLPLASDRRLALCTTPENQRYQIIQMPPVVKDVKWSETTASLPAIAAIGRCDR